MSTTGDKTRQREAIKRLVVMAQATTFSLDGQADYLLDNGVSVEVPPEPGIKPGTTGTATINGVRGARVLRVGVLGVIDWWLAEDGCKYDDLEVTDFVPDVMLTQEMLEELHEAGTINGVSIREWAESHGAGF